MYNVGVTSCSSAYNIKKNIKQEKIKKTKPQIFAIAW